MLNKGCLYNFPKTSALLFWRRALRPLLQHRHDSKFKSLSTLLEIWSVRGIKCEWTLGWCILSVALCFIKLKWKNILLVDSLYQQIDQKSPDNSLEQGTAKKTVWIHFKGLNNLSSQSKCTVIHVFSSAMAKT